MLKDIAHCDEAENGEVAIQQFHPGKYEVIFLDIQMPHMDGFAALKWIRRAEDKNNIEENNRVKVVINSALSEEQSSFYRDTGEAKYDAYIRKPFDEVSIKGVLKELGFDV